MIEEVQLWDCLLEWCKSKVGLDNLSVEEWDVTEFNRLKEILQPFIKYFAETSDLATLTLLACDYHVTI